MILRPIFYQHTILKHKTQATSKSQQSTIFQMNPPCGQVTLEDVEDIYPICNNLPDREQRYACYACYGMDMEKVEKYYPIVKQLQEQMKTNNHDSKAPLFHLQLGKFHITLCKEN